MAFWRRWTIPLGIAILGLVLNTIVATTMANTTDEFVHVAYGISIIQGSPDRSVPWFDSKMPISVLNALPRGTAMLLRTRRLAVGFAEKMADFRAARYATIVAAFCLCLLCYSYAESLFGRGAGLLTQLLFVISPNIIAHSTLATTDLFVALATILFLYSFRRFLHRPTRLNSALTASTLALAQLTKFTAPYLYLVLLVSLFSVVLYFKYGHRKPRPPCPITKRQVGTLLVLNIVFFLIFINAGFLFDGTFTPLAKYEFRSTTFQALQLVPFLREIPLPVPYAYVQGFDWMSYHNATGLTFGNIMLLDEVRGKELTRLDGFPSYYLVAYALKEPLGMQLLLILGLLWTARHRQFADFLTGEWVLLLTASVFLVMLSLFSNTQIGIRHILPVLVIFVVLSGGAFAIRLKSPWKQRLLLGGCLWWVAVSAGSYFPHMIPYFNELLTDRKLAYHLLADSNLDWGQDRWVVERFLKNNPDVVLNPSHPMVGRILVAGNILAGVKEPDYWLRRRMAKPVAQVGYAHFLFCVSTER